MKIRPTCTQCFSRAYFILPVMWFPYRDMFFHRLLRVCFNVPEEQVAWICRSVLRVRLKNAGLYALTQTGI